jgi:hypothetical protein
VKKVNINKSSENRCIKLQIRLFALQNNIKAFRQKQWSRLAHSKTQYWKTFQLCNVLLPSDKVLQKLTVPITDEETSPILPNFLKHSKSVWSHLRTITYSFCPTDCSLTSGAFAKLRKATISFVMSVGPPAWNY